VVEEDLRTVLLRRAGARPHELPGIERGVGDGEGARDLRVQARLAAPCFGDRDLLDWDPRRSAAFDELVAECGVVPRRADEQTPGVLDAVGGDAAEDRVLDDALPRCVRVLDGVASAGVEEAVVAARGAVGEVPASDEHRLEAAHGCVADYAGASRAAADHQHLGLEGGHATGGSSSGVP
jgi:hypothetical protein